MMGTKGLVGQGMAGRKSFAGARPKILGLYQGPSGAFSYTFPASGWALIYGWGGGGNGAVSGAGGAGGGAVFKRLRVSVGQVISGAVGSSGVDTSVTLPSGFVLRATAGAAAGGAPGIGIGGDINRTGGAAGQPGQFGGAGGVGGQGGGGGAGFSDIASSLLTGGAGGPTTSGGFGFTGFAPGGGSGGSSDGTVIGPGGGGALYVFLLKSE